MGTRGSVHSAEILQDGGLDKLQLLLRIGVLHVANTDPQAVCVHVVIIVAQRLCWQAAQQELPSSLQENQHYAPSNPSSIKTIYKLSL